MDGIQEINTDPSWRNILLTICIASAAIYFFFFSHDQQSSNSISHASSSTLDKDERQKRRERLAAIAEERRIAMLKRDDNLQDKANHTHTSAVDTVSKIKSQQHTKQKLGANVIDNEKVKGQSKETGDVSIGTAEKVDDDSNNENSLQVSADEVEQVASVSSSTLVGASSEEMTANNTKSGGTEEEQEDKKKSNESTGNNEDESVNVNVKEESRQRTQQAIAKLKASKKDDTKKKEVTEEEESSSPPKLLTIYLILTSCPGSSKLELSIPNNISTTTLLQRVLKASRIAITDMKLIFRGRIINNNNTKTGRGKKDNAVDEYGIEEGCALHVMGKPTLPEVVQEVLADGGVGIVETGEEVDDEAADVEQPNTYEDYEWDELPAHVQAAATTLGYSPQLWDSDGEPFSEELYWEEMSEEQRRAATILGYNEQSWNDDSSQDTADDEEMLLLIDRIRRSTGEALYHRQAREGDLNGLREAVAAGFSNILSVPDANGWTTLHEAIRAGNTDIIEYLVREVGLDLTAETNQGRNALSLAQDFHGEEGAVTLLIESLLQESEDSTPPESEE